MDEYGLLKFDTLYEMNRNAVLAFAPNDLFGTYSNNGDDNTESSSSSTSEKKSGGGFEWITYEGWGRKVDVCREVLRGPSRRRSLSLLVVVVVVGLVRCIHSNSRESLGSM